MKTKVVNLRKEPYEIYIGRSGRGRAGYFGNPFRLDPSDERGSTIEEYRKYFYKRIGEDPDFKKQIESLKGKILGCFCKPKRCHGDIIVEYLENETIRENN